MASVKRENPETEDQKPKSKRPKNTSDEPSHSQGSFRVVLNPADSNLGNFASHFCSLLASFIDPF